MAYKVGSFGTVYGTRFKKPLKQRLNKDGYLDITLGKIENRTTFRVHRLVVILFVPNPNNYKEVNHKDYNRANPSYDNLEWVSHKQNVIYSSSKGRYSRCKIGINNGRAKYNVEEVKRIRKLYKEGNTVMEIIKILYPNLSFNDRKRHWNSIKNIVTRKTYSNI